MTAGTATRPHRALAGRLQTIVILAIAAVVVGVLAWSASGAGLDGGVTRVELPANAAAQAPGPGEVAPAFTGATYDGTTVSLAEYAGKPVWLTFGASWCPDCRTESVDIEETWKANQDRGLAVLGVFINESSADVGAYADRAGLTFPIVVDPNADIAAAYRSLGIPTHVFIRPDGTVAEVRIGVLSRDEMAAAVDGIVD